MGQRSAQRGECQPSAASAQEQLLGAGSGHRPVCKGRCPGGPHMVPSSAHSAQGPRQVWSRQGGLALGTQGARARPHPSPLAARGDLLSHHCLPHVTLTLRVGTVLLLGLGPGCRWQPEAVRAGPALRMAGPPGTADPAHVLVRGPPPHLVEAEALFHDLLANRHLWVITLPVGSKTKDRPAAHRSGRRDPGSDGGQLCVCPEGGDGDGVRRLHPSPPSPEAGPTEAPPPVP